MRKSLLLLLITIGLAACGSPSTSSTPKGVDQPVSSNQELSKYSTRQSVWVGDNSGKDDLGNDGTGLPAQGMYLTSGARNQFIDHYLGNDAPANVPLNSWKNDYIAGELALSAMDLPEAQRMFELASNAASKEKGPESKTHDALCKIRLAYLARRNGDLQLAEKLYREGISVLQSDEKENERALDVALYDLALVDWQQKRFADAEKDLRRRVDLRVRCHGAMGIQIAVAMNDLANAVFYQRRFADADKLYLQCAEMTSRFVDSANFTLKASYNLANCRYAQRRYADALALYELCHQSRACEKNIDELKVLVSGLPAAEQKTRDMPRPLGSESMWNELVIVVKSDLAARNYYDAKEILVAAMKEAQAIGFNDKRVLETQLLQADCAFEQGDFRKARELYKQVLAGSAMDKAQRAHAVSRLLVTELASNDQNDAAAMLRQCKDMPNSDIWANLVPVIATQFEQQRLYHKTDDTDRILITICQEGITATQDGTFAHSLALENLAHAYQTARQQDKALPLFEQAFRSATKASPQDKTAIARMQNALALAYVASSQFTLAEPLLKDMLANAEAHPGKDNHDLRRALQNMATLYNNWHRPDLEEVYYKKEIALEPADLSPVDRVRIQANQLSNLSRISSSKGNYEEAASYLEQLIALKRHQPNARVGDTSSENSQLVQAYESLGNWEKLETIHLSNAQQAGVGQPWRQEMFHAITAALKLGEYDKARDMLEKVISDFEVNRDTMDHNFGCYSTEPRFSVCLNALANCIADGQGNYDRAITLYDRALAVPSQGPGGPACFPGNGGAAARLAPVTPEQLVDFTICCDGIGNKKRADEYRAQLKTQLETYGKTQGEKSPSWQTRYAATVALLDQSKRTQQQDIELMEQVSTLLHTSGSYSQPDSIGLLVRGIAWRNAHGGKNSDETKADLTEVVHQWLDAHRADMAEPWARRLLVLLAETHAPSSSIAMANFDMATILQEKGLYGPAKAKFAEILPAFGASSSDMKLQVLKHLAYCSLMLGDDDNSVGYLKQALAVASSQKERCELKVSLAAMYDLEDKQTQASALYSEAAEGIKSEDRYNLCEPIRKLAEYASSHKLYAVADRLYRREISLLSKDSPVGAANAWMQMGRMYRWAKKYDQSTKAYTEAIAFYKSHPNDEYLRSQIQSAEAEMKQMLSEAR